MSIDTLFSYISVLYTKLILIHLTTPNNIILSLKKTRQFVVGVTLVISFITTVFSQNPEPIYRKYNVDNGMPSSMVYHAFQDSKGYIWFATANGVSRFDGYKFENFDLQSGLVDNDVFEIYEDYKGRIWFIPISGKLAYYENGRIVSYKYNNKIKEKVTSGRGPVKCSFYVDSLDYVYLSVKHFGKISISPEGVCKKYTGVYEKGDLFVEELENGKIFITSPRYSDPCTISFLGKDQKFEFSSLKLFGVDRISYHMFFIKRPDSTLIFSDKGELFKVRKGALTSRRPMNTEEIIWCSTDDSDNLWVAPLNGGVLGFRNCDFTKEPKYNFLKSNQVSSVLKDKEGSYWFTTLNDGVFYCPNINLLTLTKQNGLADDRVSALLAYNKGLFIGYNNNSLIDYLRDFKITHILKEDNPLELSSITRIINDSINQKILICSMLFLHSINGVEPVVHQKYKIYPRDIIRSKNGGYWVGCNKGLMRFKDGRVNYKSFYNSLDTVDIFRSTIYALVEDSKGAVWFCTMNGLWKYSDDVFLYMGNENPLLSQNAKSIIINPKDSCLWIGTNGLGVVVYSKDTIFHLSKKEGLTSNSVNRLFYSSGEVWAATRQGLSRISFKKGKYEINNYSVTDGLPSNEITSIAVNNDIVYVGTSKGLCWFDTKVIENKEFQPSILITKFKVNDQSIDSLQKTIRLNHNQNLLSFDFVGLVFKNNGQGNYKYRLLGLDTTWVSTNNRNCLFSGLSDGFYTFEVKTQSSYGVWSSKPAQISFIILPPIWKQTWFLVLGSLLFAAFLFIVYRIRISAINQKNELLHNINLYKQQSLRQQMNPHFIFNTLNSIQLYILEKDPISSHKYLTKFARLMRMTLDNSLNSTIPLRDEIEALKLYLELEKIRLEGKFEYFIELLSDDSILNVKIPTLLIQPFVENAILHGIMLKENQSGWVKISLAEDNSMVICSIEDNGVGRTQADEIRQLRNKEHKSRGSQITQQRIELLSLMYKEKFNIQYMDLADEFGVATGTKVLISIPKGIKANIQK